MIEKYTFYIIFLRCKVLFFVFCTTILLRKCLIYCFFFFWIIWFNYLSFEYISKCSFWENINHDSMNIDESIDYIKTKIRLCKRSVLSILWLCFRLKTKLLSQHQQQEHVYSSEQSCFQLVLSNQLSSVKLLILIIQKQQLIVNILRSSVDLILLNIKTTKHFVLSNAECWKDCTRTNVKRKWKRQNARWLNETKLLNWKQNKKLRKEDTKRNDFERLKRKTLRWRKETYITSIIKTILIKKMKKSQQRELQKSWTTVNKILAQKTKKM
jgi:hypothetical protein